MPDLLPSLTIDGAELPPPVLGRAVDRLTAELQACGAGPGRLVILSDPAPLPIVVATFAAGNLGAPLALTSGWSAVKPPAWAEVRTDGTVRRSPSWPPAPLDADIALVLFTSGSTGEPRAVALSHRSIAYQGRATADHLRIGPDDRLMLPLPLHHAYGMSVLQACRHAGARLYVEGAFGAGTVLRRIAEEHVTAMDGIPSMYRILGREAARDDRVRRALASVRIRGCGGDLLSPVLRETFERQTGGRLHDGYGLTEAGPNVAINTPHDYREGTVGRPLAGTSIRVTAREIEVSGPGVMLGHLDLSTGKIQRDAFTRDGWLRTGDLGDIDDDGFLTVEGRSKNVLIVQGETVAPAVLEDVMRGAAGVSDVAVVAGGGGARGDRVLVFAECEPAADSGSVLARLREVCRRALPPLLRPDEIHFVDGLPRTASGKLDRIALETLAARR
ncbi:AMP-binding protein [Nonomuraea sp. NPDC005650]|uniref:class I adenylate-forming enzyme family protein n=1 Tax=Nonomuraea sp. NPDC005650 TaxID=3157045 RepID=UPI0033AF125D